MKNDYRYLRDSKETTRYNLRWALILSLLFTGLNYLTVALLLAYPRQWWLFEPISIATIVGAWVCLIPIGVNLLQRLLKQWT